MLVSPSPCLRRRILNDPTEAPTTGLHNGGKTVLDYYSETEYLMYIARNFCLHPQTRKRGAQAHGAAYRLCRSKRVCFVLGKAGLLLLPATVITLFYICTAALRRHPNASRERCERTACTLNSRRQAPPQ